MDISVKNSAKADFRIGIFIPNLSGGGAERVVLNLARGFADRGYKVDLLLKQASGEYLADVSPLVCVIDFQATRMIATLPHLVSYINYQKPDVLFSALDIPNLIVILANIFAKRKVKTSISFHFHGFGGSFIEKIFGWWLYPKANIVVAVSIGVAEFLSSQLNLDVNSIKVIYNPVITPELVNKAKEEVESPCFGFGEPPVILGIGRLSAEKDFETLLKAFSQVRKERRVRLLILGEGEQRTALTSFAKELGIEKDLNMPGFVSNPYSYMRKSSVFVLSSTREGFGNVLVEAMACGCPIVSTDCPSGPREVLKNGEFGNLVPVGDVNAMTKAILDILDGKGKPADPDWLQQFSLDVVVENYIKVLGLQVI